MMTERELRASSGITTLSASPYAPPPTRWGPWTQLTEVVASGLVLGGVEIWWPSSAPDAVVEIAFGACGAEVPSIALRPPIRSDAFASDEDIATQHLFPVAFIPAGLDGIRRVAARMADPDGIATATIRPLYGGQGDSQEQR